MANFAERVATAQQAMRAAGASLMVLGPTDHMRYLAGWAEHGHERLIALFIPAQGEPAFVVPALNAEQAKTNRGGFSRVIAWTDSAGWDAAAAELLNEWGAADAVALVDDELWAGHLLRLQTMNPNVRWRSALAVMTGMRQIKSAEELAALTGAAEMIDEVVAETAASLRAGVTEAEVAQSIHDSFKRRNTSPSFGPLVCFGPHTALPHHHIGETRLKSGDMVVIDIGCMFCEYPSDITRTFSFGEPSDPDARRVYSIVHTAHQAARAAIRPGVTGHQIDTAAREVITAAGYGEWFIHRTGHGLGLSTHEPPDMVAGNHQPLEPGMCFSIEPGIYLPGRFGVRIENIVTVTETGHRSFNAEPPETLPVLQPPA